MSEIIIAIIILVLYAVIGIAFIVRLPALQMTAIEAGSNTIEAVRLRNELRRTVIQVVGGVGVLMGLFFTWRTLIYGEANNDAQQLRQAIELLSASDQPRRLTGIGLLGSARNRAAAMPVVVQWIRAYPVKDANATSRRAELELAMRTVFGEDDYYGYTFARSERTSLAGADLSGLQLDGLKLSSVDFTGANLTDTNLENSDLRNAIFRGANLTRTEMLYIKADKICFDRTTTFLETNFQGDDFTKVDFNNCRFVNCNFYGVILSDASFVGADLADSDLHKADLTNADFRGANLSVVDRLTRASYDKAKTYKETVMPRVFAPALTE